MNALLILSYDWYFSHHWLDRAKLLQAAGYDVHVALPIHNLKLSHELQSIGLKLIHIDLQPHSTNPIVELRTVWQIWLIVNRINPSILHLITLKPVIYGSIIARTKQLTSICSLAGLGRFSDPEQNSHPLLTRGIHAFLKRFVRGTVVLENTSDKQSLQQWGLNANLQVIEGAGVDTSQYASAAKQPDPIIKILFASRLIWRKGLGELIDTCTSINQKGIRVELHIAGIHIKEDRDSIPWAKIEQWSKRKDVIWHGKVNKMPALIALCDVVCLPTRYGEGIPRILIEAAACQRPIIAPEAAGCTDILKDGHNGFMYDQSQSQGLELAIEKMIENKHRLPELGEHGRMMVLDKFSNKVILQKWEQVYTTNTQEQNSAHQANK